MDSTSVFNFCIKLFKRYSYTNNNCKLLMVKMDILQEHTFTTFVFGLYVLFSLKHTN